MIKNIEYKNHKILGDLKLNFCNEQGMPYKKIVIAGNNGTGKTSILKSIVSLVHSGNRDSIFSIQYIINGKDALITDSTRFDDQNRYCKLYVNNSRVGDFYLASSDNCEDLINRKGIVYSSARTGYKLEKVERFGTTNVDEYKNDIDSSDDYTDIKKLLIDINNSDAIDYTNFCKNNGKTSYSDFEKEHFRLYRFKNAFNNFFDDIKFLEVSSPKNGSIPIIFTKNGKEIEIDDFVK